MEGEVTTIVYYCQLEKDVMKQNHALQFRFQNWWKQCGFRGNPLSVYRFIVKRYSELHRAYHTLGHLLYCLDQFDLIWRKMQNPLAVEGALWFHDIVYDPRRGDNEKRSADLMRKLLAGTGASRAFVGVMSRMIHLTKHVTVIRNRDTRILLDIDISVLGASQIDFDRYDAGIRFEYGFVPEEAYRTGRAQILRMFLFRSEIFHTPFFRRACEWQASRNLQASLANLEDRLRPL